MHPSRQLSSQGHAEIEFKRLSVDDVNNNLQSKHSVCSLMHSLKQLTSLGGQLRMHWRCEASHLSLHIWLSLTTLENDHTPFIYSILHLWYLAVLTGIQLRFHNRTSDKWPRSVSVSISIQDHFLKYFVIKIFEILRPFVKSPQYFLFQQSLFLEKRLWECFAG